VHCGKITCQAVAEALGQDWIPARQAIA